MTNGTLRHRSSMPSLESWGISASTALYMHDAVPFSRTCYQGQICKDNAGPRLHIGAESTRHGQGARAGLEETLPPIQT